jgi:hypothetical protein
VKPLAAESTPFRIGCVVRKVLSSPSAAPAKNSVLVGNIDVAADHG